MNLPQTQPEAHWATISVDRFLMFMPNPALRFVYWTVFDAHLVAPNLDHWLRFRIDVIVITNFRMLDSFTAT
jgi:hypothetical protein